MAGLPLTVATWNYDRTHAIATGEVGIEGCDVRFLNLPILDIFWRGIRHQEFDVCEMSFSSYCMMTSRGESAYVAVPVFLSRLFRHSCIYIRTDRGIDTPADLKGRVIGVPEYQVSAALWARGMLDDEYGVKPSDIRWRTGGVEDPGRPEKADLNLPDGTEVEPVPADKALDPMLAAGEIDGLITPLPAPSYLAGAPHVGRLFPDFRRDEQDYFRRTGIFPIMHVLVIRKSLCDEYPWLAGNVYLAFERAKALCLPELTEIGAAKVTLPWVAAEAEETIRLMGEDYWPYGVEKNRAALEALTRYSFDQGLSVRKVAVEELFHPATLEVAKH